MIASAPNGNRRTYEDLLDLANSEDGHRVFEPIAKSQDGDIGFQSATIFERQVVDSLGIDVLGQIKNVGVKIFSTCHRRSGIISDVSRLSYEQVLMAAGPRAKEFVVLKREEGQDDVYTLQEVRAAIALLAGYRAIGEQTELGPGCWAGVDEEGEEYDSVVMVGPHEAAEWSGGKLSRIDHPRCRGHLLDFESADKTWYEFDRMSQLLRQAENPEFRNKVLYDLINLFGGWSWKYEASSPIVMAGLTFATWVQSLWEWRPQVAIIGASKAGKSFLFNCLSGIFGSLCKKSSDSTAAGIRQIIKSSARVILCDEFDAESKHQKAEQERVMKMLRSSGRGDAIFRGTPGQQASEFVLRHIVWLAGIQVNQTREADKNRYITLELKRPSEDRKGKLILPPSSELHDLGQRSLAVAIWAIQKAKYLAPWLKDTRIPGVDDRVIESYAVPAAILATIQGFDEDQSRELLLEMLQDIAGEDSGDMSDDSSLISAIFSAQIQSGPNRYSAAQLLEVVTRHKELGDVGDRGDITPKQSELALESHGICLAYYTQNRDTPEHLWGHQCLLIAYRIVQENLLRNTHWNAMAIDQILRRVPNAVHTRRRFGGQRPYVIAIPLDYLRENFLGDGSSKNDGDEKIDGDGDTF